MPTYTLGLEGSANKLGVAITSNGIILSNLRRTFVPASGSGFRPPEVTTHHRKHILELIKLALKEAKITPQDLTLIAYTRGPGLGGPLAAVLLVAKTIAVKFNIPLQAVNHCVAHCEMGRRVLSVDKGVFLYASGGNTQILGLQEGRYRIFGEAIDVAVGNCIDRVAREIGVDNDPAPGYNIEVLAEKWKMNCEKRKELQKGPGKELQSELPELLDIPVSVKGMDISCAGIVEFVKTQFNALKSNFPEFVTSEDELRQFFCYSLQENLFSALVEITERACAHLRAENVICVGGVGCNKRLQEMLGIMCEERGARMCGMDERFCIDNGAMIGNLGELQDQHGVERVDVRSAGVVQRWRTDSVEVKW